MPEDTLLDYHCMCAGIEAAIDDNVLSLFNDTSKDSETESYADIDIDKIEAVQANKHQAVLRIVIVKKTNHP